MKKILIYLAVALLIYFLVFDCSGDSDSDNYSSEYETQSYAEDKWYSGGTLHKATIGEWKNAAEKNKLATCADFVVTLNKNIELSELRRHAEKLKDCIDDATKGLDSTDKMQVAETASTCMIMLK